MRLWIGLFLPKLPLEVFVPSWSTDGVSVTLDQDKVLTASPDALAMGVRPGLRRGGVLMLAPDARIFDRAPEKEGEAINTVAMVMLQYTPLVALAEENVILLDVGASLNLFRGPRALCARIRADLAAVGYTGYVSCAPTARAAWLLARSRAGRALTHASAVRRLDCLPAVAIPAARPFADWLQGLGCETIGHLRRLPRPGLQRRCGRQLLDTIDSALGEAPELFEWIEAPERFDARIELFARIENADLLLAGAQRLIVQLIGFLCAKQLAAESIVLKLEYERGRARRPPIELQLTFADPIWSGDHIVRLLKERLAKLELDAPVIELALEADKLVPMAPPDGDLFPEKGASEEDQARVMELLVARLGSDHVKQFRPIADYRPEVANAWIPIQDAKRAAPAQLPAATLLRPTWLLAKPIALLIRQNRPFYKSPLRIIAGPERVEAGWWDDGAARDYFIAKGDDESLFWVFRERIAGRTEGDDPRFFLHGFFG